MLGWSVFASSLTATTGTVQAQGSVTLYGIVDTGVSYYNHAAKGGSAVGMPHLTGELPSRWGVKGTEDLGAATGRFSCWRTAFSPAPVGSTTAGDCLAGRRTWG